MDSEADLKNLNLYPMNFIIHFSAKSDEKFKKDVARLIQVESSQVMEIALSIPSMIVEPAMAGVFEEPLKTLDIPPISEQINASLSTLKNAQSKKILNQQFQHYISAEKDLSVVNRLAEVSDLLIFDIAEIVKHPLVCNSLFRALESRPCSLLFLDSKSISLHKIILKYNGKEAAIYSIYAFTKFFPQIALQSEDSILVSPFTFKKSQLAMEKRLVKKIAKDYGSLGFIKLPFTDIEDYLYYAIKVQADLLLLPRTDLKDIKKAILENKIYKNVGRMGLSFFVG